MANALVQLVLNQRRRKPTAGEASDESGAEGAMSPQTSGNSRSRPLSPDPAVPSVPTVPVEAGAYTTHGQAPTPGFPHYFPYPNSNPWPGTVSPHLPYYPSQHPSQHPSYPAYPSHPSHSSQHYPYHQPQFAAFSNAQPGAEADAGEAKASSASAASGSGPVAAPTTMPLPRGSGHWTNGAAETMMPDFSRSSTAGVHPHHHAMHGHHPGDHPFMNMHTAQLLHSSSTLHPGTKVKHAHPVGKPLAFSKLRFEERVVLEEAMMARLPRCLIFLVQFVMFLMMLWLTYPSTWVLPVHQAIEASLEVNGLTPSDVNTIAELKEYLSGLGDNWREFSPGSTKYVADPLAKTYLSSITEFPATVTLPDSLRPTLAEHFTIAVWVKTSVRFNTLMKTVQANRNGAICWQFELEGIKYGEHENMEAYTQVVHPWAQNIYWDNTTDADEAWKDSTIRINVSDGEWHHYAVMVEPDQVCFALDGVIAGFATLTRPITDCPDATFSVGSTSQIGSLVDMKYIPRVLTEVELGFLMTKGKMLDDTLAGGGVSSSEESDIDMLVRLSKETKTEVADGLVTLESDLDTTFRMLAKNIKMSISESKESITQQIEAGTSTVATTMSSETESLRGSDADVTITGVGQDVDELTEDLNAVSTTLTNLNSILLMIKEATVAEDESNTTARLLEEETQVDSEPTKQKPIGGHRSSSTSLDALSVDEGFRRMQVAAGSGNSSNSNSSDSSNSSNSSSSSNSSDAAVTVSNCIDQEMCEFTAIAAAAIISIHSREYSKVNEPSAAENLLMCLISQYEVGDWSLTEEVIAKDNAPSNPDEWHGMLPQSGNCNVVTGCTDKWDVGTGSKPKCLEFQVGIQIDGVASEVIFCPGGQVNETAASLYSDFWDDQARHKCCTCGGGNLHGSGTCLGDYADWRDLNGNGCADWSERKCFNSDRANENYANSSGVTVWQACCICGGGHREAMNLTEWTTRNTYITIDDYEADSSYGEWYREEYDEQIGCSVWEEYGICTEDGSYRKQGGLSAYLSLFPQATKLTPEALNNFWHKTGDSGFSAWDACLACGGGETVYASEVPDYAQYLLQAWGPLADVATCHANVEYETLGLDQPLFQSVMSDYFSRCPNRCASCNLYAYPSEADAQRALLSCQDASYSDWLAADCSWYALNDAADKANGVGACSRYGDSDTLTSCKKTCGTCEHAKNLMEAFDMEDGGDGKLSLLEQNAMQLAVTRDIASTCPTRYWQTLMRWRCITTGLTGSACWTTEHYPLVGTELYVASPEAQASLNQAAESMLGDLTEESIFLPQEIAVLAARFPTPTVLEGHSNLAIQHEEALVVYPACEFHEDCAFFQVTACANFKIENNPICDREFVVPMYCSPKCRTGGCGKKGNVWPNTVGSYCQPCDSCELDNACPAWCTGFIPDETGEFANKSSSHVVPEDIRPTASMTQWGEPGTFTLSAWIKDFSAQWIFERKIYMPGLDADKFDGYDEETGMLVCWRLNPLEVQFRNRWDEKELTAINNPLASKLTEEAATWHFMSLRKQSYTTTTNMRREDLQWMVDGELSDLPKDALNNRVWDVPSWGFPDCGGEQLKNCKATQSIWDGPYDFYYSESFPEFNGRWNNGSLVDYTRPLAGAGQTAIRFSDVTIPTGASLKSVTLQLCSARTLVDYLQEVTCGAGDLPQREVRLKISGAMLDNHQAMFSDRTTDYCFVANCTGNSTMRTIREKTWNITLSEWREYATIQSNTLVSDEHDSKIAYCYKSSPDLTDVVTEMLQYYKDRDISSKDLTFVVTDAGETWSDCGPKSVWDLDSTYAEALEKSIQKNDTCHLVKTKNDFLSKHMPLWFAPETLASPVLSVQYCLNDECVSPSFLGAGASAKNIDFEYLKDDIDGVAADPDATAGYRRLSGEKVRKAQTARPQPQPRAMSNQDRQQQAPAPAAAASAAGHLPSTTRRADPKTKTPGAPGPNSNWKPQKPGTSISNPNSKTPGLGKGKTDRIWHAFEGPSGVVPVKDSRKFGGGKRKAPRSDHIHLPTPVRSNPVYLLPHNPRTPLGDQKVFSKLGKPSKEEPFEARGGGGRRLASASCTNYTCLVVGSTKDEGLTMGGLLLYPTFNLRAMATSELQNKYYGEIQYVLPQNQDPLSGANAIATGTEAPIEQYQKEIVGIIPPVVFQRRSQIVDCFNYIPGISDSLEAYFHTQIVGRCSDTYECKMDGRVVNTSFMCIDRTKDQSSVERHFDSASLQFDDHYWYPEFLDMFSVPVVYRGSMVETADWVDLQTTEVMLVNVFLTPSLKSGTVVQVYFKYDGVGRIRGSTDMKSYIHMTEESRSKWNFVSTAVLILSCLDLLLIFFFCALRAKARAATFKEMPKITKPQKDIVRANLPVWSWLDSFDVAMRVFIVAFCVDHVITYPSPFYMSDDSGRTVGVENFEFPIKKILEMNWQSMSWSTEDKVQSFMLQLIEFSDDLMREQMHRRMAVVLLLLFFIRVIVYMRVHPRIAVLYATVMEMYGDVVHFGILFGTLFCVLGFVGMWCFGDKKPDFGDFPTALYTQFRMLVGEFQMETGNESGFDYLSAFYTIIYFIVVFTLLLNFFLAIVVDSYSNVKDAIVQCKVENTVFWDIWTTFSYSFLRRLYGWPHRGTLLQSLLRADLDQDFKNDEDQVDLPVIAKHLEVFGIVESEHAANLLFKHYQRVCPALVYDWIEQDSTLEHVVLMRNQVALDGVRYANLGEKRLKLQSVEALYGAENGNFFPLRPKGQAVPVVGQGVFGGGVAGSTPFPVANWMLPVGPGSIQHEMEMVKNDVRGSQQDIQLLLKHLDKAWADNSNSAALPARAVPDKQGATVSLDDPPSAHKVSSSVTDSFEGVYEDLLRERAAAQADRAAAADALREAREEKMLMRRHLLQIEELLHTAYAANSSSNNNNNSSSSNSNNNNSSNNNSSNNNNNNHPSSSDSATSPIAMAENMNVQWVPETTKV